METLTSDRSLSISALFANFFRVADFQREYVWTDEDVSNLLNDIWRSYKKNEDQQYFIGSIVLVSQGGNSFTIIDGQQRLTTLFIALCGLKARLQIIEPECKEITLVNEKLRSLSLGSTGATDTYRMVLSNENSQNLIETAFLAQQQITLEPKDESSLRLIEAYDTCVSFFNDQISDRPTAINYLNYFSNQVCLLPYVAGTMNHGLTVFETLNSRGVGLSPIDLVKNVLFSHASSDAWENLQDKWKPFLDVLEETREQPQRFLKYFILTEYGQRCADSEVFDWIRSNLDITKITQDPFSFLDSLQSFAESYRFIIQGKSPDGSNNPYIANLRRLAGRARQHFSFIIALKHFPREQSDKFILATESLLMSFGIQRMYTGDIESIFSNWTQTARECKSAQEIESFYKEEVSKQMKRTGTSAIAKLATVDERSITHQKLVYFLCRLDSYLQVASESGSPYKDISSTYKGFDIEHILPKAATNWKSLGYSTKDDYDRYASKLGNLSILEKTLNRAIKDKDFSAKRIDGYQHSAYLLTKGIAVTLKGSSRLAKALNLVKTFDSWNKQDIESRQTNLKELAAETFGWA